jgi:pyridoxamine 5'-phosphate oxidase
MDERDLDRDPIAALRTWLREAEGASARPDAMTLATASAKGRPSARVVLLRGLDERGLVFFTNRESRKGEELEENPHAALVLHWPELGRQVRVEGVVEHVSAEESHAYWETRPRESRIAAWVSPQSRPLRDRAELEALDEAAAVRFGAGDVPLPDFWGGYRVVPAIIEFWEHRENRLHDRIRYRRTASGWQRERLAP